MRVRQGRYLVLVVTLVSAACQHSFTRQDALTAIEHHETIRRLLEPDSERVAHETVADCRAIYSTNRDTAEMAGDSAWILLSGARWMDLADVDAPSDRRQKRHLRAQRDRESQNDQRGQNRERFLHLNFVHSNLKWEPSSEAWWQTFVVSCDRWIRVDYHKTFQLYRELIRKARHEASAPNETQGRLA